MKKLLLSLAAGISFGAGLAFSGMADPQRVVSFLDPLGEWDPTLLFVMGGALLVFSCGYFLLRGRLSLPGNPAEPVSRSLIIGAAIFGIGWGLGGLCPGPAIAGLGGLRMEALWFVPAMALGTFLAQRMFGLDR